VLRGLDPTGQAVAWQAKESAGQQQLPFPSLMFASSSSSVALGARGGTKRMGTARTTTTAATPTAGGTAATKAHAASGSAGEAPIEPEYQRGAAAPNTAQRIGPCSATPQTGRGLPGEWRQRRRDRRVHVGRSCGGRRENALERKEARRVKPWLSELDVSERQELAEGKNQLNGIFLSRQPRH
jgi:hypothetical protein